MVTRKSAMLPSADRQEIADLFSVANIKAVARQMNDAGIGHGDADQEYLVTTGVVKSNDSRKVYATKVVWAQSAEEAVSIARRQAMGIKRTDSRISESEVEDMSAILMFSGKSAVMVKRNKWHYAIQGTNCMDTCEIDSFNDSAEVTFSAQAMPVRAQAIIAIAEDDKRIIAEHEATIAPIMARYEHWLNVGDKLILDGIKAELKAVGVKV